MTQGTHEVGSELRRGITATLLGIALGSLVALFARRDASSAKGRGWRGRSAT